MKDEGKRKPTNAQALPKGSLNGTFGVILVVFLLCLGSGCTGVTTTVRLPSCSDRIEIQGEHLRQTPTQLLLHHEWDLPMTSTAVTVEHRDGSKETFSYVNNRPDLLRFVGAGAATTLGALALAQYAYAVGVQKEPTWGGKTSSALPIGLGALGFGVFFGVTGWNPDGDITVPSSCL